MEDQSAQRRITGLSGDKWTLHQLKAIQPALQQVDHQYRTLAPSEEIGTSQVDSIGQVIKKLTDLLRVSLVSKASLVSSVKCMGADLLTDVIRAITVYQCVHASRSIDTSDSEFLMVNVIELCEALFSAFDETALALPGVQDDEQQHEGGIVASRSLTTIAGLGNNGFEDTATMLLQCVLQALTASSEDAQHRTRVQYILSYARSYLKFSQAITRFHNNRKKLFTNLCEKTLIYAVPLLSHCNALVQKTESGGDSDAAFTSEYVVPLQKLLCELLEGGLFDEKNIEEFATLRLESTAEELKIAEETAHNNKNKNNKKAKKNDTDEASSGAVAVSSNVSVAETVSGKNKAYHDTLFRMLSLHYYESETPSVDDGFASGIAWIVRIYGDKSAALALLASNQGNSVGRGGNFGFGNKTGGYGSANGGLGSDVVNTRKHLIRVFHFSFLMLESLRLNEDEFSVVQTLQSLPACAAPEPVISGAASGKKKRRHSEANLAPSSAVSEATADWLTKVRRIVKEHQVRNEVLAACVHLLRQQSIPNHEALQKYVDRLICLSAASVRECVCLQKLLSDSDPAGTDKSAVECVQEILALNIDCVRLVASIDHTTIVDHRLRDIVQVLSCSYHGVFDASSANAGELRLYNAKGELFKAVLNVHGELRLMDQLACELFYRENQSIARSQAPTSMLHSILLARDASGLLIKLLIAAPTGQIPQLWSHLAGESAKDSAKGVSEDGSLQVGVVTCAFARALMHAQLHTVQSTISLLNQDAGATSDGLDKGTVCMTRFLRKLATTLQTLAASPHKAHAGVNVESDLLKHVLLTLSALLRFVAHMHSGTISQLVLSCPAANGRSFFEITMTTILNNLVALKKSSTNYGSILKALMSLLLLHSNVTAKVAASAVEAFSAPSQILRKYSLDLLTVDASVAEKLGGGDALLLEVLDIVLSNIRVWSQYVRPETGEVESGRKFMSAKHIIALFQAYLRASRSAALSDESAHALVHIRLLLSNAAVADSNFVREALHSALLEEWAGLPALSTTNPSACKARCEFIATMNSTLPGDVLFSATAFMPALYPVLVQACSVLAKSNPDSETASALLSGVSAAATVLGGHVRLCRGQIARSNFSVDATENPLSPFLTVVMKLVSEKSSAPGILLSQLLKLLDDALQIAATESFQDSEVIPLLCMMLDAFVSHFVREVSIPRDDGDRSRAFAEASLAKVSEFLKTAVLRVSNHSATTSAFEAVKAVFHTVISCYAASLSWKRSPDGSALSLQPVASSLDLIQELLVESLLPAKSAKSKVVPQVSGNALHFIAEVNVVLAQVKSTASSKDANEPVPVSTIQALLTFAAGVVSNAHKDAESSAQEARGAEGWLYLLGATAGPLLAHCGAISVPPSSDDDAEVSSAPVVVDLMKLDSLCRVVATVVSSLDQSQSTADRASMAVISLVASVVKAIFGARICNCEASQVVSVLKHALLKPLLDTLSDRGLIVAGLCRDLLVFFTEYGRKLLVTSRAGQEKFQAFHDSLIVVSVELFQEIAATQVAVDAQSIDAMAALLQCANAVTLTFAAVIQRQGRAGARRKNKENDTRSATFRCDLWFDGLLGIVSLSSSHLHLWKAGTSMSVSTAGAKHTNVSLSNNAASVLLAKGMLQVVERFIAVSSSSSLPNLNTAIGAVVQALTSVLSLLLSIENVVSTSTAGSNAFDGAVAEALKLNLSSCYHLLCRIFGNIASSQVLEKHIHFIACAVVETLSKTSVTRSFQEVAYPGIYSLFEKCQSRQKTQMFGMLDTQSRTLMMDLHNEFVRSFKFVGK